LAIETIALNCLLFEKFAFLLAKDRQIVKRTNRWTEPMRKGALAVASGALKLRNVYFYDTFKK